MICRSSINKKMLESLNWTISNVTSPAVDALQSAVDHPVGGVLIFWSPFSSGKTWAMRDLTKRMQIESLRIVTYLDGKAPDLGLLFDEWLRRSLGMSPVGNLVQLIPRQSSTTEPNRSTIIFIDHFEDLMKLKGAEETIRGLARESFDSKQNFFKVVLSVPKIHQVQEILDWNGGQKIRLACRATAARWDAARMRTVVLSQSSIKYVTSQSEVDTVMDMAVRGGSPGNIDNLVYSDPKSRRALLKAALASWDEGARGLEGLPYFRTESELIGK
jgi:hypothetical protein